MFVKANTKVRLIVSAVLSATIVFAVSYGALAQQITPTEVEIENLRVRGGIKYVYVGNVNDHFVLFCKLDADGCITPKKNKKYWLIDGVQLKQFLFKINVWATVSTT